jgi:hypothetical protein
MVIAEERRGPTEPRHLLLGLFAVRRSMTRRGIKALAMLPLAAIHPLGRGRDARGRALGETVGRLSNQRSASVVGISVCFPLLRGRSSRRLISSYSLVRPMP